MVATLRGPESARLPQLSSPRWARLRGLVGTGGLMIVS